MYPEPGQDWSENCWLAGAGGGGGVGGSKYTLEVILYSFFPLKNTYQIEQTKDTEHSEHIRNRNVRQSLC
jgi:hypothetical protein